MEFLEYLRTKKIDPDAFGRAEPELYAKWKDQFARMHPKSFTARNLYQINPLRRRYRIKEEVSEQKSAVKKNIKPVIKPKIKPSS